MGSAHPACENRKVREGGKKLFREIRKVRKGPDSRPGGARRGQVAPTGLSEPRSPRWGLAAAPGSKEKVFPGRFPAFRAGVGAARALSEIRKVRGNHKVARTRTRRGRGGGSSTHRAQIADLDEGHHLATTWSLSGVPERAPPALPRPHPPRIFLRSAELDFFSLPAGCRRAPRPPRRSDCPADAVPPVETRGPAPGWAPPVENGKVGKKSKFRGPRLAGRPRGKSRSNPVSPKFFGHTAQTSARKVPGSGRGRTRFTGKMAGFHRQNAWSVGGQKHVRAPASLGGNPRSLPGAGSAGPARVADMVAGGRGGVPRAFLGRIPAFRAGVGAPHAQKREVADRGRPGGLTRRAAAPLTFLDFLSKEKKEFREKSPAAAAAEGE